MNRYRVLTVCGLIFACGGKSQVNRAPAASSSGSTAGASKAGEGGTSGAFAIGGAGGSGGNLVIDGEPQPCVAANSAPGILVDVFPIPEGPRLECHALNQPGSPDSACPSDALIVCSIEDCYEAATLAGCCRPDGFCGLLETGYWGQNLALGCISRDPWIEHADELDHPARPVRCD